MTSLGSVWRRWDLHIHTPASFHWTGKKLHEQTTAEIQASCSSIVDRMNAVDVDAYCVMDYWTFDGYLALANHISTNRGPTYKRVFPGIELRLEAPTDFRLNTHVLFDDALSAEILNQFIATLRIGGPDGKPPTKTHFIELAKAYDNGKLKLHGFGSADRDDNNKMLRLGMMTAVVTRESLNEAMRIVGRERCLLIQPYDTSDGIEDLDWKRHPYDDATLMKMADMFETRDRVHVDLFLGHGHPTRPTVGEDFLHNIGGRPKPVVSGSDAHRIQDYGVYPSDRVTWLKAQPTFLGLRQVCNDPSLRCYIGLLPPKLAHIASNPTKYIRKLTISKVAGTFDEKWFDGASIEINPGLVAIIGNRGSGKSALADVIGLAGNSHCSDFEFLNERRFKHGANRAKYFIASITWHDAQVDPVNLSTLPNTDLPERVRYLPQHFIERVCNEIADGGETAFEKELKKVIFSHLPAERRLQKATLDELLRFVVEGHRRTITQGQARLHDLNVEIATVEQEISAEMVAAHRSALDLKRLELAAHEQSRPSAVETPSTADLENPVLPELEKLRERIASNAAVLEATKRERAAATLKQAKLSRIVTELATFEATFQAFLSEVGALSNDVGLVLEDMVTMSMDRSVLQTAISETSARLAELEAAVDGTRGLVASIHEDGQHLLALQSKLDEPNLRYQEFQRALEKWSARRLQLIGSPDLLDTIAFFEARIAAAETKLPQRLEELRAARWVSVREIHEQLSRIRAAYQEYYRPIQSIASTGTVIQDGVKVEFDAFLSADRLQESFFDFINRNRRGNFYGEEESKRSLRSALDGKDLNQTDDVLQFLRNLESLLTTVHRDGEIETITVQSQLRATKRVPDLYDFLFGLDYLEPHYTLKLGGKAIAQLSPGEKGALLLVFYLLLDPEEIPIVIDQPEQNLDNESVVRLLVDCIRSARSRRQVIIVTHNPNLAIVCDADQIITCGIDKVDGNAITYRSGAIEDYPMNLSAVNVLEGTFPAFDNRRRKYMRPPS